MIESFSGDYRWLSNFWPCRVFLDDDWYPSVEHAYVAAKTLDKFDRDHIRQLKTPGDAKRYGRSLKLRGDWDEIKLNVMESLLRQKFVIGSDLGNRLIKTGNQMIIEGNTWGDRFWGACNGSGENHLGKIIMKIRSELQCASQKP